MSTPYFPAFLPRLAPMRRRFKEVRQQSLPHLESLFGAFLPSCLLENASKGANSRQCIYTLRRVFFGFLYQVLNPGTSCREIVRQIQALFALQGGRPVADESGGWCLARKRLPIGVLQRARVAAAQPAQKASSLWHGFSVKVVDGTTTSLPDTPKNQRAYPQSRAQKPGCGFPLLKLVGVFSLATGVLLQYTSGNKHQHEISLFHKLLATFQPGDLVLADRGFASYVVMALLNLQGVQSAFRLHWRRPCDFRKGKRLGKNDRLLIWEKPQKKPRYLSKNLWNRLPEHLPVRLLRYRLLKKGFRCRSITLATTLLDAQSYSGEQLAALYARRWQIELWFRDIKTTLGV